MEPDFAKILDAVRNSKDPRADEKMVEAAICQRSLMEFTKAAWHLIEPSREFRPKWYHYAICEHLEALSRRDIKRLIMNVPFRSLKSTICSVMFPIWTWTFDPSHQFMTISYAEHLAIRDNLRHRRIGEADWYRERWGHVWQFSEDQNQKGKFENNKYGIRAAFGITGSPMGFGADTLLIDDPMDREAANSDAERDTVNTTYSEALSTRLNDPAKSAIGLIMQRLAERDLTGYLIDEDADDWTWLVIPMEYEYDRHCHTVLKWGPEKEELVTWDDPRRFDDDGNELSQEDCEGTLMDDERFPVEVLESYKKKGDYFYSGQCQQRPSPKGGGIIKTTDWQWWPPEDWPSPEYPMDRLKLPPFDYVVAALDTAITIKEENDYSAVVVMGMWRTDRVGAGMITPRSTIEVNGDRQDAIRVPMPDNERSRVMMLYAWQKRVLLHGPPEYKPNGMTDKEWNARGMRKKRSEDWGLVEHVVDICRTFGVHRLIIEDKAHGHAVNDELMRLYANEPWAVELVTPAGDKVARALSVQHLFSNEQIYAPAIYDHSLQCWRRPVWADAVIRQAESFPKGEHDDLVDALIYAILHLRRTGLALRQDEEERSWDEFVNTGGGSKKALYDL